MVCKLDAAGEEVERLNVARAYDGEVAAIECRHFGRAKALGGSDDRCIDGAKGKVVVTRDQLCGLQDVLGVDRLISPAARSPRNRVSACQPRRLAIRYTTSVTTRVGTIRGPG